MATIVPFTLRRIAAPRLRPSGESASIVIFPGVRYERVPAEERPKADGVPRKRKTKSR